MCLNFNERATELALVATTCIETARYGDGVSGNAPYVVHSPCSLTRFSEDGHTDYSRASTKHNIIQMIG